MARESIIRNTLLFLLLAALGTGFFLTINTIDRSRLEQERVVREIWGIRTELNRMHASFELLSYGIASDAGESALHEE